MTKKKKRGNHKGILQDNGAAEETAGTMESRYHSRRRQETIIHRRRGRRVKVTGLGDGGIVRTKTTASLKPNL